MSTENLQKFYHSTFEDLTIQKSLIDTKGRGEFIDAAVAIGRSRGYKFSVDEMQKTMDGFAESRSVHESIEDAWVRKILSIGWAPVGYSR